MKYNTNSLPAAVVIGISGLSLVLIAVDQVCRWERDFPGIMCLGIGSLMVLGLFRMRHSHPVWIWTVFCVWVGMLVVLFSIVIRYRLSLVH